MALTPRLAILIDASGTKAVGEFKKVEAASKALEAQSKKTADAVAKALATPTAANQGRAQAQQQAEQIKFTELSTAKTALMGKGLLVAGGAALAGFGLATKAAMNFDQAMSGVAAVIQATPAQLDALRQAALSSGKAFGFSASETASAEEELAKAGVNVTDILGGGLKGTLALAAAGQLSVGEAATIAVQGMNAFGLKGADVGHIADVMAAGANKSATDVHNLGQSLSQVALQASRMGLSIEETTGALALFAQNGLIGSDAGTSFRTFLQRLTPQSKLAADTMEKLNLKFYDARGQFVGLGLAAQQLKDKIGSLTPEQQAQAIQTIFGADAARAASLAVKNGAAGFDEYTKAVNDNGAASDTAAKRLDNLSGDISKLKSSLTEGLIKTSGSATMGLRGLTQGVTGLVNSFNTLPGPVGNAAGIITGLGGGLLAVGGTFLLLRPKIAAARDELERLGPAGARASQALGLLGKAAGVVAFVTVIKGLQDLYAHSVAPSASIDKLGTSLRDLAVNDKFGGELSKLGDDMDSLVSRLNKGTQKIDHGSNADILSLGGESRAIKKGQQAIEDLDSSLAQLQRSGKGGEAAAFVSKLGEAFQKNGKNFGPFLAKLDDYDAALKESDLDAQKAKSPTDALGRTVVGLGSAADAADGQVDGLGDSVDGLGKGELTSAEKVDKLSTAIMNQVQAQDAYDKSLRAIQSAREAGSDAQKDLDKLLKATAVDQEKVTEATRADDKAIQDVVGAWNKLTEAQTALAEAQKPSTFLEIQEAQDKITDSVIKQATAQKTLEDAIKARDKIQKALDRGETLGNPDDIVIAQGAADDATKNYTKVLKNHKSTVADVATAHKAMVDAQQAVTDAQKTATPTAEMLKTAEDDVTEATIGVHDASKNAEDATTNLNTVLQKGSQQDPAVVAALKTVSDANQDLADKTDAAKITHDALIKSGEGDPDWADKVEQARRKVRDTTQGLADAQRDAGNNAVTLKDKSIEAKAAFKDWGDQIQGVTDKLTQLKSEHPEIAGSLSPIFGAIASLIGTAVVVPNSFGLGAAGVGDIRGKGGTNRAAAGGIFKAKQGGWDVNLAEAGQSEAVIPLDQLHSVMGGGSGGGITIIVNGALDPNAVARQIDQIMTRYNRGGQAAFLNN